MKKYFSFACIFILSSIMFGIYVQDVLADNTTANTGAKSDFLYDENGPENTGAKSLFWYDEQERYQKGLMEEFDILLQIVHRDKDGNLISYIETTERLGVRPSSLYWYFMQQSYKEYVMIDNEPFEVIHWVGNEPPAEKSHYAMAMYVLIARVPDLDVINLLLMNHEAYQVEPGDKLEVYWTGFLPINPSR